MGGLMLSLAGVHAVALALGLLGRWEHLPKALLSLLILGISLIATRYCLRHAANLGREKVLASLGRVATWSLYLIFAVGAVQLAGIAGLLPQNLSEGFTLLFSYRTVNRLQGISGEPSWMVRYLMLFGLLHVFFYRGKGRFLSLPLLGLFLLLSGSAYGYLTVLLSGALYLIVFRLNRRSLLLLGLISLLSLAGLSQIRQYEGDNYTFRRLSNIARIVAEPEALFLILEREGSMFQRIMNPVIGFQSGSKTFFLGTGLDGYRYVYPDLVRERYAYALAFEQVYEAVTERSYITPKSLYAKFRGAGPAAFLGLPASHRLWILGFALAQRPPSRSPHARFAQLLFCVSLVSVLNTDSVINQSLIFSLYLCFYSIHE
ncbi:hypothetical protein A3SI_18255 [Nitritalea halalkaliphila LW7]|uniref:O-antigen polymerase n=1 Tax=Nitritalea halalkaliphila LW7 TaxID=1189621 RepID=I5BUL7_9BACT|nr:hypothetical protein [Nitritalea halalkaliphila]EIM73269.1 hypothetical protein A3SI_18255 [Nitritalea halalkaliphila LW7]